MQASQEEVFYAPIKSASSDLTVSFPRVAAVFIFVVANRMQPIESTEFRLRVSNSVEPTDMYAKTLDASRVSGIVF